MDARPSIATPGKGQRLYPTVICSTSTLLVFARGLTARANHTPDTRRKQLDRHSQANRYKGCHTRLWSLVCHGNRPALVPFHPISHTLKCSGRMLIFRHRAEISADRFSAVFFPPKRNQNNIVILLDFYERNSNVAGEYRWNMNCSRIYRHDLTVASINQLRNIVEVLAIRKPG